MVNLMIVLYSRYLVIDALSETVVRMQPVMKMTSQNSLEPWLSDTRIWVNPPRVVKPLYQVKAPAGFVPVIGLTGIL